VTLHSHAGLVSFYRRGLYWASGMSERSNPFHCSGDVEWVEGEALPCDAWRTKSLQGYLACQEPRPPPLIIVGLHGWWCFPHGGLQLSFQESTRPEKIDFQAISATILVTFYADFRGDESFVARRVVMNEVSLD